MDAQVREVYLPACAFGFRIRGLQHLRRHPDGSECFDFRPLNAPAAGRYAGRCPVYPCDFFAGIVRHRSGWLVRVLNASALRRGAFLGAGDLLRTVNGNVPGCGLPHGRFDVDLADRRISGANLVVPALGTGLRHLPDLHGRRSEPSSLRPPRS